MPSTHSILRAVVFPFMLLFVLQSQAKADKVDDLVKQMTDAGDYKVRLSAALNLAKMANKRPSVIRGFIKALRDDDKTVRGVAAASLGKLVDGSTPKALRGDVLAALKSARDNDSNSFVKRQAGKAYDQLKDLDGGGTVTEGGVFVDISGMGTKVNGNDFVKPLMLKAARTAFKKAASSMMTDWPGGSPSKSALSAKNVKGFHVSGTLTELSETTRGSQTIVACKVSMLVASFPERSMFGFADGGAQVQASSSPQEVKYAKEDCVSAVVENLVAKQIIPTIKTKAR